MQKGQLVLTLLPSLDLPYACSVGLLNGIAIFPLDLATFKHEYSSGAAYSAGTFLLAYSVFELSMTVLAALVSPSPAGSHTATLLFH